MFYPRDSACGSFCCSFSWLLTAPCTGGTCHAFCFYFCLGTIFWVLSLLPVCIYVLGNQRSKPFWIICERGVSRHPWSPCFSICWVCCSFFLAVTWIMNVLWLGTEFSEPRQREWVLSQLAHLRPCVFLDHIGRKSSLPGEVFFCWTSLSRYWTFAGTVEGESGASRLREIPHRSFPPSLLSWSAVKCLEVLWACFPWGESTGPSS
jgi:hypothetical protein